MADLNGEIGRRIAARLNELGWRPPKLAGIVGCHPSLVNKYIRGDSVPAKRARLKPYADALGVRLQWLVEGKGEKFSISQHSLDARGGLSPATEQNATEIADASQASTDRLTDEREWRKATLRVWQGHEAEIDDLRLRVGALEDRVDGLEAEVIGAADELADPAPAPEPSPTNVIPISRPPEDDSVLDDEPMVYRDDERPEIGYLKARVPGRAAAGESADAGFDRTEGWDQVPEDFWIDVGKDPCMVVVVGDSMIDEGVEDGCHVAFYAEPLPASGEMVVAEVEDEGRVVKRYFRKKRRVELQSANEAEAESYPPRYFDPAEVTIYGVVRAVRCHGQWKTIGRVSRKQSTL